MTVLGARGLCYSKITQINFGYFVQHCLTKDIICTKNNIQKKFLILYN